MFAKVHFVALNYTIKLPLPFSQWPRGLRRRSAAVGLVRWWVRIPPGAWMNVVCCQRFLRWGNHSSRSMLFQKKKNRCVITQTTEVLILIYWFECAGFPCKNDKYTAGQKSGLLRMRNPFTDPANVPLRTGE